MKKFITEFDCDLIKYLNRQGMSKNKVKSLVKFNCIFVNDKNIVKLPYKVLKNDLIEIKSKINTNNDFEIIYEDKNYLVVNKDSGLLTISTSNTAKKYEDTLYKRVRKYLNSKKEYAFIVNRIDAYTSGIVIFVKNEELKNKLQENWNKIVKKRGYTAIVEGVIKEDGRIDNYLYEDKLTFTHSTKYGGKRAISNYRVIKYNDYYTMLDVNIETGRKNQIRVHFSEMGHPILGDKKYYSKTNPLKRLALHHYEIDFIDPISGKLLVFKKDTPKEFFDLFN